MVGSIDPRCETVRGTHWPVKVAGVFGTRVAENHLGQRSKRPESTGRKYGCKRSDQTLKKTLAARGPSTYGTHWPVKVAGVFGTRVAENHLGQRSKRPASTGRTYGCKRSDQTLKK